MKKKGLGLMLCALLAGSLLAGCGSSATGSATATSTTSTASVSTQSSSSSTSDSSGSDDLMGSTSAKIHYKVGTTTAPDGHYVKGLLKMQELLEKYSNGEMTIDIYPNSELGNERDMMENVGMGVQDMCLISTGPIPNFVSDFAVLDLPYLFPTAADAYEVLDGEIGQGLLEQLSPQGIKGVAYFENGYRELTNNDHEIATPDDLKGMKIRTMENNVHMATYEQLGATATPMAWSEIFTALQQGTVDGQENPIPIIYTAKVYEVQKYISMIDLFYSPCVLMVNEAEFNSLTQDQQSAFLKAADEAKDWQREYSQNSCEDAISDMESKGVTVTEVDMSVWEKASEPIYDQAESLGLNTELIDKIRTQLGTK